MLLLVQADHIFQTGPYSEVPITQTFPCLAAEYGITLCLVHSIVLHYALQKLVS